MKITLVSFTMFSVFAFGVSAQSIQQRKTDSIFQLVKKYFNLKQSDPIYELAGEAFHKAMSAETFRYVAANQLFPVGEIKQS
ncbi:MAG: hypothetical protein JSU01_11575, partial [Bacteroidetes bacterium]|nr:hypothetical protein [Bacteroidota bacterium]